MRTSEGRAQLRFSDGAYVSLQPWSEFSIRDYRFDGKTDGAERGFFGLAKGAMRTVSGLIATGANDVIVLSGPEERLIPFIADRIVRRIDLDAGIMIVDWDPSYWE